MNSRGQSLDYVNKNCLINMKYEEAFKKYIDTVLNIKIEKERNIYSHYDFTYNDIHILEYKGVYYSIDEDNKNAVSNKGTIINSVMIGHDKIKHYIKMKKTNDDLRFYLFYGFYDIDKDKQTIIKIVYKHLEITNILNEIITNYKIIDWYNKDHYLIPIKDLVKIDENIMK